MVSGMCEAASAQFFVGSGRCQYQWSSWWYTIIHNEARQFGPLCKWRRSQKDHHCANLDLNGQHTAFEGKRPLISQCCQRRSGTSFCSLGPDTYRQDEPSGCRWNVSNEIHFFSLLCADSLSCFHKVLCAVQEPYQSECQPGPLCEVQKETWKSQWRLCAGCE